VKDTVLKATGTADMRIEGFGPHVPNGFPEPGMVSPFDTGNQSQVTTVITTSANGTRTITGGGSVFTTDLTMFVTDDLRVSTNATLDTVHVPDSGSPAVQAWKVDEHALSRLIGGVATPSGGPVDPSFIWFEKDTLMKVRASTNYTDSNHNYVVSVRTMEDTNIPQLKTALASQESYSTQSSSLSSSSTTTAIVEPPGSTLVAAALVVAVVVTVAVISSSYALQRRNRKTA
jgi:hypothetical protein